LNEFEVADDNSHMFLTLLSSWKKMKIEAEDNRRRF
jgi:hypothetical protein